MLTSERPTRVDDTVHNTNAQVRTTIKEEAQDNLRQVRERPALEVGDDLLDDRVGAVRTLGCLLYTSPSPRD